MTMRRRKVASSSSPLAAWRLVASSASRASWQRITFAPPTVRRIIDHIVLIQEVDPSYPIILGSDGRVMDGMHRISRAILDGHATIKAVQFVHEPEPDYRNCSPEDLPY